MRMQLTIWNETLSKPNSKVHKIVLVKSGMLNLCEEFGTLKKSFCSIMYWKMQNCRFLDYWEYSYREWCNDKRKTCLCLERWDHPVEEICSTFALLFVGSMLTTSKGKSFCDRFCPLDQVVIRQCKYFAEPVYKKNA